MDSREYKKLKIATPPFASNWLFRLFCKHEFVIHRLDEDLFEDKSLYVTCNKCCEQYICEDFFEDKGKVMKFNTSVNIKYDKDKTILKCNKCGQEQIEWYNDQPGDPCSNYTTNCKGHMFRVIKTDLAS